MKYKKGELLSFSTGEYSDYGVVAFTKVLKDFDEHEVGEKYLAEHPEERKSYSLRESAFMNYLTLNGYVEDLEYKEWRYSEYGNLLYTGDDS